MLFMVLALVMACALAPAPSACSPSPDDETVNIQTTESQQTDDPTSEDETVSEDEAASDDTAAPGDEAAPDGGSAVPESLTLTADDDGGMFSIRSGGTVLLELEANPSTGFYWEMDDPDPEASLLEQVIDPAFKPDDAEAMGAGGIMTYTFRAVDEGEMVLRMVYMPPGGGDPTRTFEVTLAVQE
jgi:predicted secreted protein